MEEVVIDTTANLAGMMDRAKILAGPDYFTCARTHARIKRSECIMRQTEGVRLEGSLRKEVPPECKECPQGREILAGGPAFAPGASARQGKGEHMDTKDPKQVFEEIKAACQDKDCQFWYADGCTYEGPLFKGECKRRYMQKYHRGKKLQGGKGAGEKVSKATQKKEKTEPALVALQAELEKPAEELVAAPSIVMDFEGMEDVYEDLEQAAQEEVRTPELQALWYVKRGLRDRVIIHDRAQSEE